MPVHVDTSYTRRGRSQSRQPRRRRSRSRSASLRIPRNRIRKVPLALQKHSFCERVVAEENLPINGAGIFKSFAFQDIYNALSYQKLFEYYTLDKVICTLRYKADLNPELALHNVSGSSSTMTVNESNPVIWFKVDHNDITADTLDVMKASMRTKEMQFTNDKPKIDIVLKPAILEEAYKSSIASTYVPKWGQKLTTQDPSVPHYGLKMYATGQSAQTYGGIVVSFKYYFTMKNNE